MAINIIVKMVSTSDQIDQEILVRVRNQLNKVMKQATPSIRKRVQDTCESMITDTAEYKSLVSGELLAELGIPEVSRRLRQILNGIRKGVEVIPRPVAIHGQSITGGLSIGMLRSSFEDLLRLPAAEYVSNGRYVIPWLQWILIEGDRVIVLDHEITYNLSTADKARSRTGMALMRVGGSWRVPPEFSGVQEDNFLTRAFKGNAIREYVSKIIYEELQSRI